MKNCDEMVNSLLERRDRYTAEQEKRRKILTRTVTPHARMPCGFGGILRL